MRHLKAMAVAAAILVGCLAAATEARAAAPGPVPPHVKTDAQKAAWRIGWPRWGGPFSCGAGVDCGYQLVEDLDDAHLVWKSQEPIPDSELQPIRSGYCSPVVADGRAYLYYGWPNGLDVAKVMAMKDRRERGALRETASKVADDTIVCIDATNGKTLWKRIFEKRGPAMMGSGKSGGNYTLCIHAGKAYAVGAGNQIYCLDAATGDLVWQAGLPDTKDSFPNGCPLVAEGALVFVNPDNQLMYGYNADTGKALWTTKGPVGGGLRNAVSPLVWETGGRELIFVNKSCVDPRDGKVLWQLPGQAGGVCTAVSGEYVLTGIDGECGAFRITPAGPVKAWSLGPAFPINGFSMPVVYRDHAYFMTWKAGESADDEDARSDAKAPPAPRPHAAGPARRFPEFALTAVELKTGKIVGEAPTGKFNMYQANAAEGRFFWRQYMAKADPSDCRQLSMQDGCGFDMAQDTSSAYVCGWLLRRGLDHLLCYDLRKETKVAMAAPHE